MTISLTEAIGNPVPITTGATTFEANPLVQSYAITTGGTSGVELINLPNPPLIDDGANGHLTGRRVTFFISTQTTFGDLVKITVNGFENFPALTPNLGTQAIAGGAFIDFEGSVASFVWISNRWVMDKTITGANDSTNLSALDLNLVLGPATSEPAQGITITASTSDLGDGGNVSISGGDSVNDQGGDVEIRGGFGVTNGNVIINDLPVTDPSIASVLWNDGGVVKVSGTPVNVVQSNITGIAGAAQITNIVAVTQAEYDAIVSPSATTLYVIVE